MNTTTHTPTGAELLREQVAAKVETIATLMAAYDRDPNRWTCDGDCEESQRCDEFDARCDDDECFHAGECAGPDECDTAEELQTEYGGDGPCDAMHELPASVTYERNRPLSVLLTGGGPRVELVGDVARPGEFRIVGKALGVDPVTMTDGAVTAYARWWVELFEA